MTVPRPPIRLPGYELGDEAGPNRIDVHASREVAERHAASLRPGDAAFVLRSGQRWTYAVVALRTEEADGTVLEFHVDEDLCRKCFPRSRWGKYVRAIEFTEAEIRAATASVPEQITLADSLSEKIGLSEDDGIEFSEGDAVRVREEELRRQEVARAEAIEFSEGDAVRVREEELRRQEVAQAEARLERLLEKARAEAASVRGARDECEGGDATDPALQSTEPIKLLDTPLQFYKARTMQEDPAAMALAATSFADDGAALAEQGVELCDEDPEAAVRAKALEINRMRGGRAGRGVAEMQVLEEQGVTIVEGDDTCWENHKHTPWS